MANDGRVFTAAELEYLGTQRLGRLATLAADGTLQNNPVGFEVDAENGVIDIRGRDLGNSRKFRNVAANSQVAFVVDDIASVDPWVVRCLEIRGTAEALTGQPPPSPYVTGEVIRIHPRRIISWGLGADGRQSGRLGQAHPRPRARTVQLDLSRQAASRPCGRDLG